MRKLLLTMVAMAACAACLPSAYAEFSCSVTVEKSRTAGAVRTGAVAWNNAGSAIDAPYVRLEAGDGILVRFTEADAWTKSLEFLATSDGSSASRLPASASGSVSFLCKAASDDGKLELSWTLSSDAAFPWSELGASMKPSSVPAEAWTFALNALKDRLGQTWDSYLSRFRKDADYLAGLGRPVNRIDRLWQFEIGQALGNDPVLPTLAAAQDAARSARGLGLSFTRTYPSSLSARFARGVFGYGWSDNYSTYAELTDDKTLVFRLPGGGSYSFTKETSAWEPEDARDQTKLIETGDSYALTYPDGTVQTFSKANLRTASIADNQGNALTFAWSGTRLQKVTHTDGQSLAFSYAGDRVASVTDDCGRRTTYAYSGDLLVSVTTSDGCVTRYEYRSSDGTAAARALSRIVYPDGTTREFGYGAGGFVSSVSVNGGDENTTIVRDGGVVTVTSPDGGVTVLKTGVSGETLETTDALGGVVKNGYTEDGLLSSTVSPSGLRATVSHDALGRAVETVTPSGAATEFTYDKTFGNLRTVRDARGQVVTYGSDKFGRGTSVKFPDGGSTKVAYGDRGDVVKSTNRRGKSVTFTYDGFGRLAGKRWPDGRTFSYSYDVRGNLTSASDSETGTIRMEYDDADRLLRIAYPNGRGFTFAYDAYGRLSRRTSLDGAVESFAYDAAGRIAEVSDGGGLAYLRNAYDSETGRLTRQTYGNGTRVDYLYDLVGRVVSIEHRDASGEVLESLQYCYDADGRCLRASSLLGEERYSYDKDGQLTGVSYPNSANERFAYDAVGNRTSANGVVYASNKMNQYTQVGFDALKYDKDGNLVSVKSGTDTTTYEYDPLNRLVAVKDPAAGIDWSCKYDALGNRVSVTDNGVTTERVYLPGALPSVAAEYVDGRLTARHVLVGAVRVADVGGDVRYYHADLLGSTRLTTDAAGQVTGRAAYRAFGGFRAGSADVGSAGYVGTLGVETDPTGLLFMRNRYYSPALGRFIQPDPIGMQGADENLYRYCGNAPVRLVDPNGQFALTAAAVVTALLKTASIVGSVSIIFDSFEEGFDLAINGTFDEKQWRENLILAPAAFIFKAPNLHKNYKFLTIAKKTLPYLTRNLKTEVIAKVSADYPLEKLFEPLVDQSIRQTIGLLWNELGDHDKHRYDSGDDDPEPGPGGGESYPPDSVPGSGSLRVDLSPYQSGSDSFGGTVYGDCIVSFVQEFNPLTESYDAKFFFYVDGVLGKGEETSLGAMRSKFDAVVSGSGPHVLSWVLTGRAYEAPSTVICNFSGITVSRTTASKAAPPPLKANNLTLPSDGSRLYSYERYVVVAGVDYSFQLSAEDGATVSVSGLPAGFSYAGGIVSGCAARIGTSRMTITASGPRGRQTKTVDFEVIGEPEGFAALRAADVPDDSYNPPPPETGSVLHPFGTDVPFTGLAASTYDGYLQDANGAVAGTISVKTSKAKVDRKTGARTCAVTVTVNLNGRKKETFKATLDLASGKLVYKSVPSPELVIGGNGLVGRYDVGGTDRAYSIVGSRNYFTAKPAEKEDVVTKFKGRVYTLALQTVNNGGSAFADGYSVFSVAIGAAGKVKTSAVLADGTKVSVTGKLLVGEDGVCCVPVSAQLYSGKLGGFGFLLWLDTADPASARVDALSSWNGSGAKPSSFEAMWSVASVGTLEQLNGESVFNLGSIWPEVNGAVPLGYLLPQDEMVVPSKGKWTVEKSEKVKIGKSGALTFGKNPSGLKLSYQQKTGLFTGSFSVYTMVNNKLKKVSSTVNGTVSQGVGYGTAVIKNVGSIPVRIKAK